ncbi:MAG: NAD-dependent epimerase/dehydratase family protein [Proteobacteria bacterium]|nr:NAD-dependent epimerase/dehydratase family protein [Pseudomonadota bacterium]
MTNFDGTQLLVVGGAGFVGSNLVHRLIATEVARITIVDNLLSADRRNLPDDPRVDLIEASIADDDVLAKLDDRFDHVFHLATFHGNQNSIADPLADHQNNTLTTLKLFERISRFTRLRSVVYASAGCTVAEKTYDEAAATAEDAPVSLWHDSPYQISKLIGEFYANYYFARHKLPVIKARFQNVYGPREILGAGAWRGTVSTVWRNVTPGFVYRALKGMPLVVDNGGQATRDFIYVDDIVEGLVRCATKGAPGEVYNLASGQETSILELAEAINRKAGNSAGIDLGPPRDWDRSGRRYGDPSKAEQALGFSCAVNFDEGLDRTIAWTRANMALIDGCIERHRAHLGEVA